VKEFVVTDLSNPGLIELVLGKTQLPADIEKVYMHDFCCTHGDSMISMELKNESGQPLTGFGMDTFHVGLKPALRTRELVNVGLLARSRNMAPQRPN
jgi:hypothetical protein